LVLRDPTTLVDQQPAGGGGVGWMQWFRGKQKPKARKVSHSTRGSLIGRGAAVTGKVTSRAVTYTSGNLRGQRASMSGVSLRTPSARITSRKHNDPTDEQLLAALELLMQDN
jgi:hypothetical protein